MRRLLGRRHRHRRQLQQLRGRMEAAVVIHAAGAPRGTTVAISSSSNRRAKQTVMAVSRGRATDAAPETGTVEAAAIASITTSQNESLNIRTMRRRRVAGVMRWHQLKCGGVDVGRWSHPPSTCTTRPPPHFCQPKHKRKPMTSQCSTSRNRNSSCSSRKSSFSCRSSHKTHTSGVRRTSSAPSLADALGGLTLVPHRHARPALAVGCVGVPPWVRLGVREAA